jgi:hypothetical protein
MKHISFKDWETNRSSENNKKVEEDKLVSSNGKSNAEILAEITTLREKKGVAAKNKSSYDHQIFELDIKLLELELEKNRLNAKKKELSEASEIAKQKQVKDGGDKGKE